jgi:cytochrome c biogenesis protein CcdA
LGERVGAQIGDPHRADLRGFFLFGLGYGLASLSCTLPVFLSVVGGSVAVRGPLTALGQFILYGLGMGSVILALTLSLAVFEAGVVRGLRRVQPYVERAGALLAIGAGAYIVYYWLTLGGRLASFR